MEKLIFFIPYALVAQLDRVTGYEPVGQGFESLQTRQVKRSVITGRFFVYLVDPSIESSTFLCYIYLVTAVFFFMMMRKLNV